MSLLLTRRRLLAAGLAGAGLGVALLAGCSARVRTTNADGTPFDDARRASADNAVQRRDGFSFVESDWVDATRDRAVPVRLYLPAAAASDAPLPLVLFSHGLGGSRRGYSYLGSHFARNGIASLHVQHVGSDRAVWGGSPFELTTRLQAAAQDREAVERVADLRFALDRLLALDAGHPLRIAVDPARVIVAGHSYGANTALLASGAKVERDGRVVDLRDARIATAILLSAPPFYGDAALASILRPVTVPTLHVTATGDEIKIPGYYSPAADRVAVFEATGSTRKALAVFQGGSHSIFTDRAGTGGVDLNPRVKQATQELSVAFLASVLDDRHDGLRTWPQRHREIVARFDKLPALV
jgi:pimeloyl-ACP methyl ester carboxylesterase